MLGTSEVESVHLLNSIALTHGLLEEELIEELTDYLTPFCQRNLQLCISKALEEYKDEEETNEERAIIARNTLLNILSDARTVAPLLLTAKYHVSSTPDMPDIETFFYVFAHRTASKAYIVSGGINLICFTSLICIRFSNLRFCLAFVLSCCQSFSKVGFISDRTNLPRRRTTLRLWCSFNRTEHH